MYIYIYNTIMETASVQLAMILFELKLDCNVFR